jgi:hypothetical protein
MKIGRFEPASSLLQELQQLSSDFIQEKPSPPSLRLGIDVPFDVAVLDNLAHALDAVGSVSASCNCSNSALAALKRHTQVHSKAAGPKFKDEKKHLKDITRACSSKLRQLSSTHALLGHFPAALRRMLMRDAADDREAAVQELHDMSALFDVLPHGALMRVAQGMVAVFQSSALSAQLTLLKTMHSTLFSGHACIFFVKATAVPLLIGVIESSHFPNTHKNIAIKILSLMSTCCTAAFVESRALHFAKSVMAAAATPDVQKYAAILAIGRQFKNNLHLPHPLPGFKFREANIQIQSADLVLGSGRGLWHLALLKSHVNSTIGAAASEVLKLATAASPMHVIESHLPHIMRVQQLLAEHSSTGTASSTIALLAFGVTCIVNQQQFYVWVQCNASRLLLQAHGLQQMQVWLQDLRQEHGGLIEQFTSQNDWTCNTDSPAAAAGTAITGLDRALFAAKHNAHALVCGRLIGEYLSCYNTVDVSLGGGYSILKCMAQYAAARLCFYTNEQACLADPPSSLAPPSHSRIAATRFGPMLFLSLDFYFRVGLGVYGEWSYLEAAAMQAAISVGGSVVDVGTHIGTMLLAFAQKVGSYERVIGIEAQRNLASIATQTAVLNGHAHVHDINAAIDSSTSTCLMAFASQSNEDITSYGGFGVRL